VLTAEPTADELFRAAVLPEALVPVTGEPTPSDNRALAQALHQFSARQEPEDVSALMRFVERHPNSPWRVAVLVNLGLLHYQAGRFSLTFPAWEEAWTLGRPATEPKARALVDRGLAELVRMNARVGRIGSLDRLFAELGDRPLLGSAGEIVASARQSLYRMKHEPWMAFRCGPFALDRLLAYNNPSYALQSCTYESRSTTNGLSLQEVYELSGKMGLKLQPAKRAPGAAVLLPAVINWKVDHYAAIVADARAGNERLLPGPGREPASRLDEGSSGRGGHGFRQGQHHQHGPVEAGLQRTSDPGQQLFGLRGARHGCVQRETDVRQPALAGHPRRLHASARASHPVHARLQPAGAKPAGQPHLRQLRAKMDLQLDGIHFR
jgi:hypothetical protein